MAKTSKIFSNQTKEQIMKGVKMALGMGAMTGAGILGGAGAPIIISKLIKKLKDRKSKEKLRQLYSPYEGKSSEAWVNMSNKEKLKKMFPTPNLDK